MKSILGYKLKSLLFLTSITLLLISCEKVEQQKSDSDKVVVEGYLIADQKIKLNISKEIAYNSGDTAELPIEGLQIVLANDEQSEQMIEDSAGIYISNIFVARSNQNYSIEFVYHGTTIKAKTSIPEKPSNFKTSKNSINIVSFTPGTGAPPSFPDPIELTWSNLDSRYYLIVVENIETDPTPIFDTTRYELKMKFRNKPVQTNVFDLDMRSFNYYGSHRVILFNLNPEYASLYEDNGNSSLNLTTPPSNIENGLGIFTGINSDTLSVEVY
jgi:hypothetical protein